MTFGRLRHLSGRSPEKCDREIVSAGSGTRTHTHKAQDPKSCLSTNFNIPAVESAKILIFPGKQKANGHLQKTRRRFIVA